MYRFLKALTDNGVYINCCLKKEFAVLLKFWVIFLVYYTGLIGSGSFYYLFFETNSLFCWCSDLF